MFQFTQSNMKPARTLTSLLQAGALALTGCQTFEEHSLTGKLWSDPSLTDYYEPSGTPTLKSFQRPPGPRLLVAYDERREKDSSVRRRAFFLPENTEALAAQRKPTFTRPAPAVGWTEVPVVTAGQPTPAAPLYLTLTADNKSFTIVRHGVSAGPYQLPTYVDPSSTAFRVVVTPLAVAADVTVVAVVCGVVGLYAYAHGPFPLP